MVSWQLCAHVAWCAPQLAHTGTLSMAVLGMLRPLTARRPTVEPSKKEKFNAAPPPTLAYTTDMALAVAANAADRAKQEVRGGRCGGGVMGRCGGEG